MRTQCDVKNSRLDEVEVEIKTHLSLSLLSLFITESVIEHSITEVTTPKRHASHGVCLQLINLDLG